MQHASTFPRYNVHLRSANKLAAGKLEETLKASAVEQMSSCLRSQCRFPLLHRQRSNLLAWHKHLHNLNSTAFGTNTTLLTPAASYEPNYAVALSCNIYQTSTLIYIAMRAFTTLTLFLPALTSAGILARLFDNEDAAISSSSVRASPASSPTLSAAMATSIAGPDVLEYVVRLTHFSRY